MTQRLPPPPLHTAMCVLQCCSLSSHPPPHTVYTVCSLYVLRRSRCSCPADRFISNHFSRFHIYVLIYGICFSLSDLLHSVLSGSRFIHLTRTDSNPFLFMTESYSTVYMYHNFFICSSVDGRLGFRKPFLIKGLSFTRWSFLFIFVHLETMRLVDTGVLTYYFEINMCLDFS